MGSKNINLYQTDRRANCDKMGGGGSDASSGKDKTWYQRWSVETMGWTKLAGVVCVLAAAPSHPSVGSTRRTLE